MNTGSEWLTAIQSKYILSGGHNWLVGWVLGTHTPWFLVAHTFLKYKFRKFDNFYLFLVVCIKPIQFSSDRFTFGNKQSIICQLN